MQSKGNYVGIDKKAVFWLPRVGQFTKVEALLSLTIDLDSIIHKTGTIPRTPDEAITLLLSHHSVKAYAARWEWGWHKVERFIKKLIEETATKRRGNGEGVSLIFKDLESTLSTERRQNGDIYKPQPKKKDKRLFTPPSIEDVIAYCLERKNGIDGRYWHDSYKAKGWMIGKSKMKDWKAAVRTWERNEKPGGEHGKGQETACSDKYDGLADAES